MRFNLSAWALNNRPLVLFCMVLLAIIGSMSYSSLGQSEDPPFTFKAMVIHTVWPGATAEEVAQQVTERIEKKADGNRGVRESNIFFSSWGVTGDFCGS